MTDLPEDPEDWGTVALPQRHHAAVVEQTEALVDLIRHKAQTILNGLADRPKPGAKAKAREAVREVITANGELWKFIEGKKPVNLVASETARRSTSRVDRTMPIEEWEKS